MKTSDVLVLDCNWQPVGFCTWKRAVRLWYKSRAIILKEDESGRMLRSDGFETGLPRIILVNNCWPKKKRDKVQYTDLSGGSVCYFRFWVYSSYLKL